jgi:ABC-type Fe3+/spermidine/putrescine transport system ATPase subunit
MADVIRLENIVKRINGKEILSGIDLEIKKGEAFGIFGSSGCGKTTLLRIISGLEFSDSGNIYLRGKEVASKNKFIPPEDRNISFIFQDLGLWPHMNVREHLKFVLNETGEIENILDSCGLVGHEKSKPEELSGGEKQRLALARAIAQKSDILLLDEPFSSLDFITKDEMKRLLKELHKQYKLTIVYVTHDIFEIVDMCDRVGIVENGVITKIGNPSELLKSQFSRMKSKLKH